MQTLVNITAAHSGLTPYVNSFSKSKSTHDPQTTQNTVEDLHNLMLARNSDDFSAVGAESTIGKAALSNANWQDILNGSNDDAGVSFLCIYSIQSISKY
jgi:hypothetical protein